MIRERIRAIFGRLTRAAVYTWFSAIRKLERLVMDLLVCRGDEAFEERMRLVRLFHRTNSMWHRRSASSRGDFRLGGNMESISSFQRTASAKVLRVRCGSIPLQSGNTKADVSRRTPSFVGARVS
jgi:hypothetical protein